MAEKTSSVLVVDDERFFREAIQEALASAGIACETADSGEAALAAVDESDFGVVVLDMGLPETSGVAVLKRLREQDPALRVIILAGHSEQAAVLEALRLEACDYLAKPLHDEELVLAVRRALRCARGRSARARARVRPDGTDRGARGARGGHGVRGARSREGVADGARGGRLVAGGRGGDGARGRAGGDGPGGRG
jgi:DNA-binding NtrC family response regulator